MSRRTPRKPSQPKLSEEQCTDLNPPLNADGTWDSTPESQYLGSGSFGAVYGALYNGKQVAIKYVPTELFHSSEIKLLLAAGNDNPFVNTVYDYCESGKHAIIIMEKLFTKPICYELRTGHISGLLLYNKDKSGRSITIPVDKAFRFMAHLLLGLQKMHENNIVHRDIKHDNVLLSTDPTDTSPWFAKYIDFGVACQGGGWLRDRCYRMQGSGTPRNWPLEMLIDDRDLVDEIPPAINPVFWDSADRPRSTLFEKYRIHNTLARGKRQDVWALGVLLLEYFTKLAFRYYNQTGPQPWAKNKYFQITLDQGVEWMVQDPLFLKKNPAVLGRHLVDTPDIFKIDGPIDQVNIIQNVLRGMLDINPSTRLTSTEAVKLLDELMKANAVTY